MQAQAVFSQDDVYRYSLAREVSPLTGRGTVNFVMLNPSTADAVKDDPTIRRCIGFARTWGYRRLTVTNVFALRSTDPKALRRVSPDPVGPANDAWVRWVADEADLVVCAWGAHATRVGRHVIVLAALQQAGVAPMCLGTTRGGYPRHPMYLAADAVPIPLRTLPRLDHQSDHQSTAPAPD